MSFVSSQTGLMRFSVSKATPAVKLYRDICREMPRVFTIFNIDMPIKVARQRIGVMIRENQHVKDDRVIKMLVSKGYLELEEACLQYKTKHQLLNKLDPITLRKYEVSSDPLEAFLRGN